MTRVRRLSGGAVGRFLPIVAAAIALGCLGVAPAAWAEDFSLITEKGQASLGTFLNRSKLKIRVDGSGGEIGTKIDWDDTFGRGEQARFRLDGVWRFTDRHHLRLMLTDYSASRKESLDQDIQWGEDLILAGSSVKGSIGFTILEAAYEYAFRHDENLELALTAGLHYTTFEAKLVADIQAGGGGVSGQLGGKASVDAPLPVFGARGMWRLNDSSFYLDAQFQWFALSIDEYDGSLINYRASLIWQPKKLIGIGVGYDSFNVNVDVKRTLFKGTLDWTYQGPQVYFNIAF
jgi:hypothetical protein